MTEAVHDRHDDLKLHNAIDKLVEKGEQMRVARMNQYRSRSFFTITASILCVMAGAGGFGWFFLMLGEPVPAIACMVAAIFPPLLMNFWKSAPLSAYERDYKTKFLPQLAATLGGLRYYPTRGIGAKILPATGVVPPHHEYVAEDCFMGTYKGVKVILSEACLYGPSKKQPPLFQGIYVLLEIPVSVLEGHTVITADAAVPGRWTAGTKWASLHMVPMKNINPAWDIFKIYSNAPEAAGLVVGERLLKELAEASVVFDNAPLTAVLFREKYIFMAIPYKVDMFEPSHIHVPISTQRHALKCKREIDRILEIVDVFELYREKTMTAKQPNAQ